mmetsp:Transcript_1576/g.1792  ORF Transcript_1576/g.1792 Transcript_1576/m.1792 type:complete len:364 (-) Transcript_1576:290-1381(-)|eukprot:CAMPEP_0197854752 /NCGR_PEP_ID=MMETSP1438-20131217/25270_1 /TAXON_ID=1461541 /ORGANISM="Pterosperma sp., Strain CCMP1384" /LENGTH=363 /DNA_ID=CAMNT_0043469611 /DNA_START=265 /DNA_END=1356 /DNA_ORIENTATION=+
MISRSRGGVIRSSRPSLIQKLISPGASKEKKESWDGLIEDPSPPTSPDPAVAASSDRLKKGRPPLHPVGGSNLGGSSDSLSSMGVGASLQSFESSLNISGLFEGVKDWIGGSNTRGPKNQSLHDLENGLQNLLSGGRGKILLLGLLVFLIMSANIVEIGQAQGPRKEFGAIDGHIGVPAGGFSVNRLHEDGSHDVHGSFVSSANGHVRAKFEERAAEHNNPPRPAAPIEPSSGLAGLWQNSLSWLSASSRPAVRKSGGSKAKSSSKPTLKQKREQARQQDTAKSSATKGRSNGSRGSPSTGSSRSSSSRSSSRSNSSNNNKSSSNSSSNNKSSNSNRNSNKSGGGRSRTSGSSSSGGRRGGRS